MPDQEVKSPISDKLRSYLDSTLAQIPTTKKTLVGFGLSPESADVTVATKWKSLTIAGYAAKTFKGGFTAGFKGMFSF